MKQGRYEYKNTVLNVTSFGDEQLTGRIPEKEFMLQLLAVGAVITPIICTSYKGTVYLMDGRRRVVNSQAILGLSEQEFAELEPDNGVTQKDFSKITAKVFDSIPPDDQKAWSLILNEQRKDNAIHAWITMRELQKAGKWDEISTMHRLNKQRFKSFAQLNNLDNPELWITAYQDGKVAEGTLWAIAKLGGRQQYVENVLKAKDKVVMEDVKEAKTAEVAKVLSTRPFDMDVPEVAVAKPNHELFIILEGETVIEIGDFHTLFQNLSTHSNGKLYRLVEVT